MVIKPEHKKAAAAILHEIHQKAMKIHGDSFKSKYKGEDAPGAGSAEDELEADGDSHPKHDLSPESSTDHGVADEDDESLHEDSDEDSSDGGDEDDKSSNDDFSKGHPDLLALRKLAKKHGK